MDVSLIDGDGKIHLPKHFSNLFTLYDELCEHMHSLTSAIFVTFSKYTN